MWLGPLKTILFLATQMLAKLSQAMSNGDLRFTRAGFGLEKYS